MEFWMIALQTKLVEYLAYRFVVLLRETLLHPRRPWYLFTSSYKWICSCAGCGFNLLRLDIAIAHVLT